MSYNLLLGGDRPTIAYASFIPSPAKLKVHSESPAPPNASWIEPPSAASKAGDKGKTFYTLSEDLGKGLAVGLELQGEQVKITGDRRTSGGPAHVHCMKDGSGIVVTNYIGGTIIFFPTNSDNALVDDSSSPNLSFPFPYKDTKAPNAERQDTPHPHQVIEGESGTLYVPDLGSDRVWVVKRDGESALKVEGYLQCPPGSGPRHAVISKDGKYIYVLTELSQEIFAWTLSAAAQETHPLPDFKCSIAPPTVPPKYHQYLGAAELILHPNYPSTLFASNRHELHIKEEASDYPNEAPSGDAVAIIQLSASGDKVEDVKHVRTECDAIRGMNMSPDGNLMAIAGATRGGVEIWKVAGEKGDDWRLAGKNETIEGVTTIVWT